MGGDAIDWGRHGQDKGQVSGVRGGGWTCRPCVPVGHVSAGCRQGSGVSASGRRGKLAQPERRVHRQSAGGPTCGGLLGLVLVKLGGERQAVRCREGPRGLPIQKMHRRPRGPGSREQQDGARKLVFSFR